jgi:hypothetical protein
LEFSKSPLSGWLPVPGQIVETSIPLNKGAASKWIDSFNQANNSGAVQKLVFFLPSGIETSSIIWNAEESVDMSLPNYQNVDHDEIKLTIVLTPEQVCQLTPIRETMEFGY